MRCDVALGEPFEGGVRWEQVRPSRYDVVLVVSGPVEQGLPIAELIRRFSGRRLVGLNLTLLERVESWNPWATLIARDGVGIDAAPDLTLASKPAAVPVVARVQADVEKEYERSALEFVHTAFDHLLAGRDVAVISVDARLDGNASGLRTAAQVEALIGRADVVLATRPDGLVLALRAGVPALAVDPIPGGAAMIAQARAAGWPHALVVDELDDAILARGYEACLSPEAAHLARECASRAADKLEPVRRAVRAVLSA